MPLPCTALSESSGIETNVLCLGKVICIPHSWLLGSWPKLLQKGALVTKGSGSATGLTRCLIGDVLHDGQDHEESDHGLKASLGKPMSRTPWALSFATGSLSLYTQE